MDIFCPTKKEFEEILGMCTNSLSHLSLSFTKFKALMIEIKVRNYMGHALLTDGQNSFACDLFSLKRNA